MGAIITRKQVEAAFKLFCEVIPPPEGERWILESNNPGDGRRRYGLYTAKAETKGEFGYSQPMGCAHWGSGREAVNGLDSMRAAANFIYRNKRVPTVAQLTELFEATAILADHARERYPHFESERGQQDIDRATVALDDCRLAMGLQTVCADHGGCSNRHCKRCFPV